MVWRNEPDATVTRLLHAWRDGDSTAPDVLLTLLYSDLRALAAHKLGSPNPPGTLQPTELVHDAYIRLIGSAERGWNDRRHFIASAVAAMRSVIVDRARARASLKRGGPGGEGVTPTSCPIEVPAAELAGDEVLAAHAAIQRLEAIDPRAASVLTLRCFGGLSLAQVALVLDISERVARRDWEFSRRWLRVALSDSPTSPPPDGGKGSHGHP